MAGAYSHLALGVLLGGLVAVLSHRLRTLTAGGAMAMFALAVPIFGFGGWKWTLPIAVFFILSSLLSRLGRSAKARYDSVFEKGSRRDGGQVLANGGVAGALMVLSLVSGWPSLYPYYCAALASATADTWATEVGTLSGQRPRRIPCFRPVPAGASGGVTLAGLLSALAGGMTIALSGWVFLRAESGASQLLYLVGLSGFLGSLVDSLLGATLQVQYRCPACGVVTERRVHCGGRRTAPVSGFRWMNNDAVNFLATLSGPGFLHLGMIWMRG